MRKLSSERSIPVLANLFSAAVSICEITPTLYPSEMSFLTWICKRCVGIEAV